MALTVKCTDTLDHSRAPKLRCYWLFDKFSLCMVTHNSIKNEYFIICKALWGNGWQWKKIAKSHTSVHNLLPNVHSLNGVYANVMTRHSFPQTFTMASGTYSNSLQGIPSTGLQGTCHLWLLSDKSLLWRHRYRSSDQHNKSTNLSWNIEWENSTQITLSLW